MVKMTTICLIEDDIDTSAAIGKIFEKEKCTVSVFSNGRFALDSMINSPPDLILLDLYLPDMDGLEVCDMLKKNDQLKNIPVIMITGRSCQHEKIAGFIIGADDYITKPFQPGELKARVRAVLRRYNKQMP